MTIATIKRIVGKIKLDPELAGRLADTANLVDDVGLDSLEMLQFMLELEAALAIQVDFDRLEFSYLHSIATLAAFLEEMPRAAPRAGG